MARVSCEISMSARVAATGALLLLGLAPALLAALPAPADASVPGRRAGPSGGEPVVATFSIVAADTTAGIWGVAVASKFLAVGSVVPWARAGFGAVATQAFANTRFGPQGLELLSEGLPPGEVLDRLLGTDSLAARRQVGMVDSRGRAATWTGPECMAWAGGRSGAGYAAQGNILAGPEVVQAMAASFEGSAGFLGDRLLAALRAGDAAGGDRRGRQSAALLLVSEGKGYGGMNDIYCDLRVDDHASPLDELVRIYHVWRPNQLIQEGYGLVEEGRFEDAIARGEEAARLLPDAGDPLYHLACYHARAGGLDRAMHYLEWAIRLDGGLREAARTDPDLAPLRDREAFRLLVEEEE